MQPCFTPAKEVKTSVNLSHYESKVFIRFDRFQFISAVSEQVSCLKTYHNC